MRGRSVIDDIGQVQRAIALINLGARLQVLESETSLSRERLLRLYKEIRGESPPKGMLPFATDWFCNWQANIHASLFMAIYQSIIKATAIEEIDALITTFRLYREHCGLHDALPVLSFTRAWRLIKFIDAGKLRTAPCARCKGRFVMHADDLSRGFVCGLCASPSHARKTPGAAARRAAGAVAKLAA